MAEKPAGIPYTIAVDFDGVVCEYDFPRCGPPRQDIIELLRQLKAKGWRIIIHSSRVNACWPEEDRRQKCKEMVDFLAQHKVPFDDVWGMVWATQGIGGPGKWEPRVTDNRSPGDCDDAHVGKPVAHVYLDDRAVHSSKSDYKGRSVSNLLSLCVAIANDAEFSYRIGLKRD
jgi:hypothetical protein